MSDSLLPLVPGEVSLLLERASAPRPLVVKVLLFILIGPGVGLTLLAAPIVGLVTKSWLVVVALVGGAALMAGLGWLISALSFKALASRQVHVQLTSHRAITERHGVATATAWSDVVALSALRSASVDLVGEVTWFDVAALVIELAVDASANALQPTSPAYWSGAAGLVLKTRSGLVHPVPTLRAATAGAGVARALAAAQVPLTSLS